MLKILEEHPVLTPYYHFFFKAISPNENILNTNKKLSTTALKKSPMLGKIIPQ